MEIGTLTKMAIRDVWPTEDGRKSKAQGPGFTPWLADNADLLGEVLGMDLGLHEGETEARVGAGLIRSDVVFRDDSTQKTVVVENMFGSSDHDHLGKLISYAAGLGAAYAVLISENFKDEHRNALRWLNSNSDDCAFFGVALEAWRINDSPPAPWLRVEVCPDGWPPKPELNDSEVQYQEFWTNFLQAFGDRYKDWRQNRTPVKVNSLGLPLPGLPGTCRIYPSFQKNGQLRVFMYCSKDEFHGLQEAKAQIESRLGESLVWEKKDKQERSVISLYHAQEELSFSKDNWQRAQDWLIDAVGRMREAVTPVILDLGDETP